MQSLFKDETPEVEIKLRGLRTARMLLLAFLVLLVRGGWGSFGAVACLHCRPAAGRRIGAVSSQFRDRTL